MKARLFLIMIKIKNIIRYEQLTDKSFSAFDSTNEDEVLALLYCIELPEQTFEVFKRTTATAKRALESYLKKVNGYMEFISQFFSETKKKTDEANSDNKKPEKVTDLISILLFSGIDTRYVMEEMEIQDLPMFIGGLEKKKRADLENDRLWTFYHILPQVGKGITKPQDMCPFPWEEKEIEQSAKEDIERNAEKYNDFIKNGKNFFKNTKS